MNLIVCGGRKFNDAELFEKEMFNLVFFMESQEEQELTILTGEVEGADEFARNYAREQNYHLLTVPLDVENYGDEAWIRVNESFAEIGNICLAFWDGKTQGTKHMIDLAIERGIKTIVIRYIENPEIKELKIVETLVEAVES